MNGRKKESAAEPTTLHHLHMRLLRLEKAVTALKRLGKNRENQQLSPARKAWLQRVKAAKNVGRSKCCKYPMRADDVGKTCPVCKVPLEVVGG